MVIGVLKIEIYIPHSHALKDKRKTVKGLKDRLKNKFNVSVAELYFKDKWQRSLIGIVTINSDKSVVEKRLQLIIRDAENTIDGELLSTDIEFL